MAQVDRFKEAARELGCDDSEEAFDEALKKVARHATKDGENRSTKGQSKLSRFGQADAPKQKPPKRR